VKLADRIREALREVVDPEIGVNIVDLGLVYEIHVEEDAVRIRMTMTSPACPMGMWLCEQARQAAQQQAGARKVAVELVWDPPWQPAMMSEAARSLLGWTGKGGSEGEG